MDDVKDGFISLNGAMESYGVIINSSSMLIDQNGTKITREQLKNTRGPTKLFHRFNYFDSADEEFQFIEAAFPRWTDIFLGIGYPYYSI